MLVRQTPIVISTANSVSPIDSFPALIKVIYEDRNFLALDKPAGLLVHQVKNKSSEPTLVDWLLKRYPEIKKVGDDTEDRPGIVHRLDKETSGILLIPKTQDYFEYLKRLFQSGAIKKTYLVLVWGKISRDMGIINKPIGLKSGTIKRTVFTIGSKMIKQAVTEYKVKEYLPEYTLLEVSPKTGRTHQIRVHLTSLGHPVVGDKLYGKKKAELNRLFLHAYSLEFAPEPGKRIKLTADMPSDLTDYLRSAKLGGQ